MIARLQQREQRRRLRRDAAGERDAAAAAFEARHALLEHRGGRVHDPRVGVPVFLQVEVGGGRLRILEHVAGGLEDRHRARAGVRVGPLPGVHLARVEAEGARRLGAASFRHRSISCAATARRARKSWIIGVWRASSRRKQSWPYGASMTCSSTSLPVRAQRPRQLLGAGRRIEPVGAERDQQRARRHAAHRLGERALAGLAGEVEVGQRPRRVEIGVGVEALDERVGLVAQVALDLELGLAQRVADVVGELQPAAELVAERRRRQVGDVADHPRHAHAGVRLAAGAVVVAVLPGRIGHDRAARDRVPRHALRLERRGAGDDHDGVDVAGVAHRPLERLHAAERSAGHRGEARGCRARRGRRARRAPCRRR